MGLWIECSGDPDLIHFRKEMSEKEVFHSRVFYSGRVQGVGFRYLSLQIAKEFDVSGFVRNLPDGRVQLEAEGDEEQVRAFTAEVADRLSVFIRNVESTDVLRKPAYAGFEIAR